MPAEVNTLEIVLITFGILLGLVLLGLIIRWIHTRRSKQEFLSSLMMINYSQSVSGSISLKGFTAAPFRSSQISTRFSMSNENESGVESVKRTQDEMKRDRDSLQAPLKGTENRTSKSPFVMEVIRECEEKLQEINNDPVNLNPLDQGTSKGIYEKEIN